jgi:hypothetical protein
MTGPSALLQGIIKMPTVLRAGPYRFFFYAGDYGEPAHIHVERDRSVAKYWLEPVRLARSYGFTANELRDIEHLVAANLQLIMDRWNEFFNH